MAKNTDEKLNIQEAVTAFVKDDISKAGINLFTVLGYDTSLQAPLDDKTYEEFKGNYIENSPNAERFSEDKAMTNEWKSIDILFQLTDNSFSGQLQLFDSKLDPLNPQSYLCFAIELHGNEYTKSQIANITREVNKLFPIPIFIVFKYGEYLTLAIINRRVNKRDNNKDVLEKVTLIKDIIFAKPHRAHVEYNELLCQHKKIHRFKVYKLYSLFVFQLIVLEPLMQVACTCEVLMKSWYNGRERCKMSEVAFADFTEQALSLSYEQTIDLMGKLLESLKTKRREEAYADMEKVIAQSSMSSMWEELKDDSW